MMDNINWILIGLMMINVGNTMINHHIFDGLYHLFMVNLGMVDCVNHLI